MARALLNTTIQFGLVSIPIAVMPMESKQEVELDRGLPVYDGDKVIDYHSINSIEVDAVTRVPRGENEAVHGSFLAKANKQDRATWADFRPISPEALAAIDEETKIDVFEIEGFIPTDEIPFERAKQSYYLAPKQGQAKQLKLLYEALKASGKAGYLKLVIRKRQHAAVVYAKNGGIYLSTLAWGEDFASAHEAGETLATAEVDPKLVSMAMTLIESMATSREDLDGLTDGLRVRKAALLEQALAGKAIKVVKKDGPTQEPAGDLMAKLEASLAAAAPKPKKSSTKAKAASAA